MLPCLQIDKLKHKLILMKHKYRAWHYRPTDKMSRLVLDNNNLILILNRFKIRMGFDDQSIEQVCNNHNIDVDTFLALVNFLTCDDKQNYDVDPSKISPKTLIAYLRNSHDCFLNYRLPTIRKRLSETMPSRDTISMAILNFYDEYMEEVKKHAQHEDDVVFGYIEQLLENKTDGQYSIDIFNDTHDDIDSKLSELKNIIIKYYPSETTNELASVLFDIFACKMELLRHSEIEDYLLIPTIRKIEQNQQK